MNLNDIRTAVAGVVHGLAEGDDPPLTGYAYPPDSVAEPAAYVQVESVTYDRAFAGTAEVILTLMVLVSRADDVTASARLDGYLSTDGDASVQAAINTERPSLGGTAFVGVCDDVHVVSADAPRWYEYGSEKYLGVGLKIRVIGD